MSLVILIGPPAVGKMTVGLALEKLTGLRLFHNHMSIDLASRFFEPTSTSFGRVIGTVRRVVMEEVAASRLRGMIFTYVWSFDDPRDAAAILRCAEIFAAYGRRTFYVELEAEQSVREWRNTTELRLSQKPSKRDVEASRAQLWRMAQNHKNNSTNEFQGRSDYLRIDNTHLSPEEVADRIQKAFKLPKASE